MILVGIRRFWIEPIKDIGIQRFPNGTYQRYWNSEVPDRTWFQIESIDDFWNSEVLDAKIKEAKTEFRAPISKVKEAKRTSISKIQPYKKLKGRSTALRTLCGLHFEGPKR
ncbi:unnamed protein product [Rhizophagus irregularis]|nr:unnamed protein product [Rhizophagus irregularis]